MADREIVNEIIEKYKNAWENQDPEAALEIFTKDATYQERILEKPFIGHPEIKRFWIEKAVKEQKDIHFKPISLFIDGNVAISEWEADFFDKKDRCKKYMRGIMILEIKNKKIASLREYWKAKQI